MSSKPTPIVAANWKSNGSLKHNAELIEVFNNHKIDHNVEVIVAPTSIHLEQVKDLVKNPKITVSSQNCIEKSGAFTGEISVPILKDFGIKTTILGHSERRSYYGETNEVVANKVKAALDGGLTVIACIGETLKDREAQRTAAVVLGQLSAIAKKIKPEHWKKLILAYEPVWAIGTGKVATNQQAQEVHAIIRHWLSKAYSPEASQNVRILYGGSVGPKNAKALYQQPDINGFLVGGASLKPDFTTIIDAAK